MKVRTPNTMTVADAITTEAPVTVYLDGRMVRGRVSRLNHPNNPVLVITLPGGGSTTMETRLVLDAIRNQLILNW